MRLTTALAPAWNQNNAEPSAAFVAHIEAAFIEPRHDQHDSAPCAAYSAHCRALCRRQVHDGLGARSANGRCDGWCDTRGSARRVAPLNFGGEAYSYSYDPRQVCRPATGRGCYNNLRAVGTDLSQLLKAETAEQEVRSVASQLKARFPVYRAPAGFIFPAARSTKP
jgi:hypothetical protein